MTTGTFINALSPSEAHIEIVRKSRALISGAYAVSKDPVFRSPHEIHDEMKYMLVVAAAPAVQGKAHYVLVHDVMDGLNAS